MSTRGKLGMMLALAASLCTASAVAQESAAQWPDKPVHFIVPFAVGGSTDLVMRRVADELGKETGHPMIVENRVGGGGLVGASWITRQKPDGYTLMIGTISTHAMHPSVFKSLPYDIFKDFTPVTMIGTIPDLIVVNPQVPAKTLPEFIALAKAKPGRITYASGGPGTSSHLGAEYFAAEAGIKLNHIPYKGSGPALVDALGGHVDMMLDVIMTSLEPVKNGRMRALAVTSLTRSPLMPDVPTVDELGIKNFEAIIWFAIYGPAGLQPDMQQRIADRIDHVLQRPDMKAFLLQQGIQVAGTGPAQLSQQMRTDYAKWKHVVEISGFEPQ
ncbi:MULTISPECIES: tripartite tricarboxylate transporter substrate binding protein [unclassified Achromobacter]|uniref:Bug family tripartite tricarboxylate transporter substrate binding protein n=1 Tax=unclassified Achromobacter TaxID=2626865 RepID=UPI001303BEED|nr:MULTISPECIES: tripartite tricarboxylate transporter substrate binding protein [unclassified Achromobacter]